MKILHKTNAIIWCLFTLSNLVNSCKTNKEHCMKISGVFYTASTKETTNKQVERRDR